MKRNKQKTIFAVITAITMLFTSFAAQSLTSEEKQILTDIRNNIFGGSRLSAAFEQNSISGAEPVIFPLEVEDRGLLVWKIPEEYAQSFVNEIGLTPPFILSKITPLTVKGSQTYEVV